MLTFWEPQYFWVTRFDSRHLLIAYTSGMKVIHFRKLFNTLQTYSVHPRITNAEMRINAKEPKKVNEAKSGKPNGWLGHASGFAWLSKMEWAHQQAVFPPLKTQHHGIAPLSLHPGFNHFQPWLRISLGESGDACPKMLLRKKKNLPMLYYPTPSGLNDPYLEFEKQAGTLAKIASPQHSWSLESRGFQM